MKLLGVTGSIAMGKSAVAHMFRAEGIPVFDADHAVHDLLSAGGTALPAVAKAFPEVMTKSGVDRAALGARVFDDTSARRRLEAIVHPLVARRRSVFLRQACARGAWLVVLEIPLLFETGLERDCDAVAVASAPARLQRRRMMARDGMTEEKMTAILAAQMPDREKRRHADFVIHTGWSRGETRREVRDVIDRMRDWPARVWPDRFIGRR